MAEEDEEVPILLELQTQIKTETDIVISSNSYSDNEYEITSNGHSRGVGWSSPLGYVMQFLKWIAIMKDAFGGHFLVFVMIVYGVTQGFAEAMKRFVGNYYWKDVQMMQPAYTQSFMALSSIPWDIKPVYGLITDTFPIAGYQRWPYLVICGIGGCLCLWALAFLKQTPWAATFLMAAAAVFNAFPDVVADASLAQCSKIAPTLSSDLQSLAMGSLAVGALVGGGVSGAAVYSLGPQHSYLLVSVAPLLLIVAALALSEHHLPNTVLSSQFKALMHTVQLFGKTLRDPVLWRPALYIYLSQVVSALIGLLDIILVSRMNHKMHIPDQAFVLGDEALADAISKIQVIPMLVLSSQLCPAGIEATIFAFLMSVSNFGHTCGYWFGVLLLKWLHVQKDDYSKLWLAVLTRSLMRLSPLLFLFLIPDCTVENIKPPCISLSNDTQTMENAEDTELVDNVSVHDSS